MASRPTKIPVTRAQAVLEQLREEIRSGTLPGATRLRQAEVAGRFGVSTTPVREAFVALEREGLLRSDPHRGVIVCELSPDKLEQIYEIRVPLEALAARHAALNRTPEEMEAIERALIAMEAADRDEVIARNADFHTLICDAAHRPRLAATIGDLREASSPYVRLFTDVPRDVSAHHTMHREIFEAVKARAPRRAEKMMARHLEETAAAEAELLRAVNSPLVGER